MIYIEDTSKCYVFDEFNFVVVIDRREDLKPIYMMFTSAKPISESNGYVYFENDNKYRVNIVNPNKFFWKGNKIDFGTRTAHAIS